VSSSPPITLAFKSKNIIFPVQLHDASFDEDDFGYEGSEDPDEKLDSDGDELYVSRGAKQDGHGHDPGY
jgi:hypothetical protein